MTFTDLSRLQKKTTCWLLGCCFWFQSYDLELAMPVIIAKKWSIHLDDCDPSVSSPFCWVPSLKTNSWPLKIGLNAPKRKDRLPTTNFQGLCYLVSRRVRHHPRGQRIMNLFSTAQEGQIANAVYLKEDQNMQLFFSFRNHMSQICNGPA